MRKITQYEGDVVMFLLNKIIKNVGLSHGFKPMVFMLHKNHVHGFKTIDLKPCERPSKQPIVLLYMV